MGLFLAFSVTLMALTAPPQGNPFLGKARELLEAFDEDESLKVLDKAVKWPHNTPHELAEAHLLTGLAWAAKANESKSIESFRLARLLDPEIRLTGEHSPRVREWYERAGFPPQNRDAPIQEPEPTKVVSTPPVPPPEPKIEPVPPKAPPDVETRESSPRMVLRWGGTAGVAAGLAMIGVAVSQGVSANQHYKSSTTIENVVQAQGEHAQAVAAAERANWLYAIGGVVTAAGATSFVLSF